MIIVQAETELSDYINGTDWILSLTLFYSNNRIADVNKAIPAFK